MSTMPDPGRAGQVTDPPIAPRPERSPALSFTPEEVKHVRVALRKAAAALGGFAALSARLGVRRGTLYDGANPNKPPPSAILAIRLAAFLKVPVETMLAGRLEAAPAKRAA
jgi:hypothetical protein